MDNDNVNFEFHKKIAIETNGKAWSLLDKEHRSPDEDLLLIESAYTSLYHWRIAGTAVHTQRGEWFLARIFSMLEKHDFALAHAQNCLAITRTHTALMADFDVAYAHEGMARALALNNQGQEASEYLQQARELGKKIQNPEDRQIYTTDLNSGNWFGLA